MIKRDLSIFSGANKISVQILKYTIGNPVLLIKNKQIDNVLMFVNQSDTLINARMRVIFSVFF